MALEIYRKKRQFGVTPEPRGRRARRGGNSYVIQKHAARRLHYDLRLELDGVMKSWAVTRGPSLDPGDKRLAVHVEDHPIEYNTFEGTIPEGEYGGGTVMIWDRGHWLPDGDPHKGYAKGHLVFDLDGEKLHGRWHLVRMQRRGNDRHENWLLIKGKDEEARSGRKADILEQEPLSAATGRSMDEIAGGKGRKRVWHSNRTADGGGSGAGNAARPQSQRAFREELRAQAQTLANTKAKPNTKLKTQSKAAEPKPPPKAAARGRAALSKKAKPAASARAAKKSDAKTDPAPRRKGAGARLPDFIPPALATLHDTAPSGPDWLHEIKFDGYRIEARLDGGTVQLFTRNRQDWTHRFAPIAEAVAKLPATRALLDGELVVEDDKGVSSFSMLQIALKEKRTERFVYWLFDILHLDGADLTGRPLVERKAALAKVLRGQGGPIRYAEHFDTDGSRMLEEACAMGLEGVVSKRRDAPYSSGRTENLVKTKCHAEQEFVVAGFTPSTAMPRAIGALTVGFYDEGELRYAGRVGTGYTHGLARDLWQRLDKLRTERPPLAVPKTERRKDVVWVKPQMVIEAEFRGITHDGLLRQASYKGLREDKPAGEVVRETAAASVPAAAARRTAAATVKSAAPAAKATPRRAKSKNALADMHLTHPDRVYWADVGVTKQDLAEYYASVWDWMAAHVADRPLALVRCPDGTAGECFFQKHIAANVKDSAVRHLVDAKEHDVIAVENLGELISLVQSGALEIHVRGSRLDALEMCDRIVFDLDPGEGVTWQDIAAAARETRDRLKAEKLESFVKLSGGKGVHVMLPHAPVDWDAAKAFAQRIALAMAADSPQRFVGKMTKALRRGKIFIDYFRNSREATSVAAYSTRSRPGAPVSLPLPWEQLSKVKAANQFTVLNLKKHIRHDAWRGIDKVRQRLPSK